MLSRKVVLLLVVFLLGVLMLRNQQFVSNFVVYVDGILLTWNTYGNVTKITTVKTRSECPMVTKQMRRNIKIDVERLNITDEWSIKHLQPGGRHSPPDCKAKHRVAVIIPYRDRWDNLRILVRHLHPYLQRRHLEYGIFVVEQTSHGRFNRAVMINTGFVEASKVYNYNCFIFHDADLLPENDGIPYTCEPSPLHMTVAIDVHKYKLYYTGAFGGVTGFTPEHFKKVNGFSNLYFGWGAEDDDMYTRVLNTQLKINRLSEEVGRYKKLEHEKAKMNSANYKVLKSSRARQSTDGLNSLKSHVVKQELKRLYTWIVVNINETEILKDFQQG